HARGDRVLLRTSGTSGVPRSVERTTASRLDSFPAVESLTGFGARSRAWIPAPLTGTMNLFAAVHARHVGAEVVDDPRRATHWFVTPTALRDALDEGGRFDGVHAVVAGDRLAVAAHDRAVAAGISVSHYYGAAELSFVAWGPHEAALRAFPGVQLQVRDGVVWARSAYLSDGYVEGDGPFRRDSDGWASVGDHGALVDGLLTVTGRDDVVVTGGATVRVADVEGLLGPRASGGLAVVGVPHPRLGEVVAIVLEHADDADALRPVARAGLDRTQQPRRWFALEPLPRTEHGKLDRAALAEAVRSGAARVLL
ncbi:MAG: o-succinylbenzoate--CoA ligase, partial [Candidatus Nanopelagicales bacterium]